MAVDLRAQGRSLTADEEKDRLYAADSYFRETWADWRDAWGDEATAHARQLVVVVFKPETVVTRTIGPGLDFLREHGFLPIWCVRVAYTRHMNRAAWRYQYEAKLPSVDRLAVSDLLLSAGDALCVILRDSGPSTASAASVRAGRLKGSMTPAQRRTGELRAIVGGPNRMLSGVHMPDEPADVVRELGILCDGPTRRTLLREIGGCLGTATPSPWDAPVAAAIAALYHQHAAVTLDVAAALARTRALIATGAGDHPEASGALREMLAAAAAGTPLPWNAFLAQLERADLTPPLWDRLLLGTTFLQENADA